MERRWLMVWRWFMLLASGLALLVRGGLALVRTQEPRQIAWIRGPRQDMNAGLLMGAALILMIGVARRKRHL